MQLLSGTCVTTLPPALLVCRKAHRMTVGFVSCQTDIVAFQELNFDECSSIDQFLLDKCFDIHLDSARKTLIIAPEPSQIQGLESQVILGLQGKL